MMPPPPYTQPDSPLGSPTQPTRNGTDAHRKTGTMKLLALAPILLTAEARLVARKEWPRFGEICDDVNITNTNREDNRAWKLEGICGTRSERKKHTLDLDVCVGNEDGALVWRKEFVAPLLLTLPGLCGTWC